MKDCAHKHWVGGRCTTCHITIGTLNGRFQRLLNAATHVVEDASRAVEKDSMTRLRAEVDASRKSFNFF